MKRLLALLALFLSTAGEAPKSPEICAAQQTEVTPEQIAADPDAWMGHCVSMVGIEWGVKLLSNREAMLDPGSLWGNDAQHSIVLYPVRANRPKNPQWIRVTGRIGSCAAAQDVIRAYQADHPDQIVMVSGYCHVSLENYISRDRIEVLDRPTPIRLTEADVRAEERRLVAVPGDLPGLADHAAAAEALLRALQRGDRERFRLLSDPELRVDKSSDERREDWYRQHQADADVTYSKARATFPFKGSKPGRPLALIAAESLTDLTASGNRPTSYKFCWCRTADCSGKWPVLPDDADNLPSRPYYCIATSDYVLYGKGTEIEATVPAASGGFAEPDWAAPRRGRG